MLRDELLKMGNPNICPGAVIVKNACILLGYRNYTPDKWKSISVWTTPGGRSDAGESVEQALRREVLEEVGISDLTIIDYIGEFAGANEALPDRVPMFYCTTSEEPTLMEPEKFSEWKWIPLEDYWKGAPYNAMNPAGHKAIGEYLKKRKDI